MKENSKEWLFFFDEGVSRKEARWFVIIDLLLVLSVIMLFPFGNIGGDPFDLGGKGSLYYKVKETVVSYSASCNEKKAKEDVTAPIDGYSFVKLYHLVVADTKKDQAYYYGQTAAIFKGENDYLLCYKADEEIKKIPFKNWSDGSCKGVIVEDAKIIRFSGVYPDKDGCEFNYVKDGAFCESYFWRRM